MKGNRKTLKDTAVSSANSTSSRTGAASLRPPSGMKGKQTASSRDGGGVQTRVLTHRQIAERARAIWLGRGCLAGEDERNWLEAEAQLRQEMGLAKAPNQGCNNSY